ncbi:hypothetical protein [Actinomadura parmotrematis]|uniref:Uncharacterized protein n=1 Tax=Actinomadura parmotrematis TaxID=2864039 RepID=A0ABS7FTN6_9ACTN|nr:hypothetical protein [Actinomadura parmotrematis]MBW8483764.1 hypothetical protein [Actinomadura parmotrematis]
MGLDFSDDFLGLLNSESNFQSRPSFHVREIYEEGRRWNEVVLIFSLDIRPAESRDVQKWELRLSYPLEELAGAMLGADSGQREWIAMMMRTHVAEWWATKDQVAEFTAAGRRVG